MQHHGIYISGLGLALGDEETQADARAAGLIAADQASPTEQRAIRRAGPTQPSETLAGRAAWDALVTAGLEGPKRRAQTDQSWFASIHYAANTLAAETNPAAAILGRTGVSSTGGPAFTVHNGDQGVIDGLEAGARYVRGPQYKAHAIVAAGGAWPDDRHSAIAPFPRWRGRLPYSDGAGALVLTSEPDKVRLVATTSTTAPGLAFTRRERRHEPRTIEHLLKGLLLRLMEEAEIELSDITHLITPFGSDFERTVILPQTSVDQREFDALVDHERDLGYLGAADLIAGLEFVGRPGYPARNNEHLLLLASGIASIGAAVIEIKWPRDDAATR